MDAIQINRKNKMTAITDLSASTSYNLGTSAPIHATFIRDDGDRLLIAFNHPLNHKLGEGQPLMFVRYIYGRTGLEDVISANIEILEKTTYVVDGYKYDAVFTTKPAHVELRLPIITAPKLNFVASSGECQNDYDCYFDEVHHYLTVKVGDEFVINDWLYHYTKDKNGEDKEYFIVEFDKDHNIFAQDVDIVRNVLEGDYSIDVENEYGGKIGRLEGIAATFEGLPYEIESGDTLDWRILETCSKFDGSGQTYNIKEYTYTHTKSEFSRRRIIFTSASTTQMDGDFFATATYLLTHGKMFRPIYNPYYFYTMQKGIKICTLWYDPWWPVFNDLNNQLPLKEIYKTTGEERCILGLRSDYWIVPTLELSEDNAALGVEDAQDENYAEHLIQDLIPDVIDMERFKYAPIILEDEESEKYTLVKSLIFDFHFRKRAELEEVEGIAAPYGKYPVYDDGWYIDADSGNTIWWNGFKFKKDEGEEDDESDPGDYSGYTFDNELFTDFYNESGKTSDLLGYLGFTDEDIYYRKSKLSKSFIRLSFYTSKDPLTQKLLYYSTSFLDATKLYGKYMNQSQLKVSKYTDFETTPVVFYPDNSVSARLDSEIIIKNEFNTMASSEGFNIYLFADDAAKTDSGKTYRTIYMKIEFNHAGNGKTIPMVMWPKGDEGFDYITTDTFMDNLYIPVRVGYIDGKYYYTVPDAENEDGNLRFILFEPKLTFTKDGNSDEDEEGEE